MLLNLALNHTVIASETGYFASSPDELALVNAASYMGLTYVGNQNGHNTYILEINGRRKTY
jgi:magnesium-transporting ATPase (P-type)